MTTMKILRLISLAVLLLQVPPASASDAIQQYLAQTGESDHFRYAVFNPRWLSHSLKPGDAKETTRIAITGVLPGVKGEVAIPSKVTAIPFGLFWRCGSLSRVTLPDGITSIGNYAFADCTQLPFKALPKELKTVGAYAFKNCKELKSLKLPAEGIELGRGAFQGSGVEIKEAP